MSIISIFLNTEGHFLILQQPISQPATWLSLFPVNKAYHCGRKRQRGWRQGSGFDAALWSSSHLFKLHWNPCSLAALASLHGSLSCARPQFVQQTVHYRQVQSMSSAIKHEFHASIYQFKGDKTQRLCLCSVCYILLSDHYPTPLCCRPVS